MFNCIFFNKLKKISLGFGLFCIIGLIFSCDKRDEFSYDLGLEYYPLVKGKYWIYSLDSITYDTTNNGVITIPGKGLLKEEIVDTLVNQQGITEYIIERYFKKDSSDVWHFADRLTQHFDLTGKYQGLRKENNGTFIKVVFPVENSLRWDGNAFIDPTILVTVAGESIEMYKDWTYFMKEVNTKKTIGNYTFDATIVVQAGNNREVKTERRFNYEVYAKGVGLVYKEMEILDTQNTTSTEPWEVKAQKGFILKQILIDHN
ncbi:MAG: hypothetical protein IPO14_07085 [Saprospiraceae bacterium]|jgi:hypothetical protein|nr:hypothetical protein [Saprospiraceae bacterium]